MRIEESEYIGQILTDLTKSKLDSGFGLVEDTNGYVL